MNWDHLRYFTAAAEIGSLSAAARALKADTATVSRHIAAIEEDLGAQLFRRHRGGLTLTAAGERLAERTRRIEREVFALGRDFDLEDRGLHGRVVMTATETIAVPLLAPALGRFMATHPGLAVTLVTDYRSLNLSRREADVALRLVRPQQGNLTMKKVGEMAFGLYAAKSYLEHAPPLRDETDLTQHRILDWAEDYPMVPVVGWLRRRIKRDEAIFNADSAFARIAAAKAGMGIALIPHILAAQHKELVQAGPNLTMPVVDLWLISHKDLSHVPRVRAVMDFVSQTIQENRESLLQSSAG